METQLWPPPPPSQAKVPPTFSWDLIVIAINTYMAGCIEAPGLSDRVHQYLSVFSCTLLVFLWSYHCPGFQWFHFYNGDGDGTPLQYSCLENPTDGGAWWAAVHEVAKSRTRLSDFTFTFHFYALEKEMATHSSVLAWRIPNSNLKLTLAVQISKFVQAY